MKVEIVWGINFLFALVFLLAVSVAIVGTALFLWSVLGGFDQPDCVTPARSVTGWLPAGASVDDLNAGRVMPSVEYRELGGCWEAKK